MQQLPCLYRNVTYFLASKGKFHLFATSSKASGCYTGFKYLVIADKFLFVCFSISKRQRKELIQLRVWAI